MKTRWAALLTLAGILASTRAEGLTCPGGCVCLSTTVECKGQNALKGGMASVPAWTENLIVEGFARPPDLSAISPSVLENLVELRLESCGYKAVPPIGAASSLRALALTRNEIIKLKSDSFPPLTELRSLRLSYNNITSVDENAFAALVGLEDLRLNRNRIEKLPMAVFRHQRRLVHLDLSKNKLKEIDGLFFRHSNRTVTLDLRHNKFRSFKDGAFFGLTSIRELKLDQNRLSEVSKAWTYGLDSLTTLSISHNMLFALARDCWEWSKRLSALDLSDNILRSLNEYTFEHLSNLRTLRLDGNEISSVDESAFSHLTALEVLDLSRNRISWTVEDMNAPFAGLQNLRIFSLAHNHIKSVGDKAFYGLDELTTLDMRANNITSLQEKSFASLQNLHTFRLNTTSLLCDCDLKWFLFWMTHLSRKNHVEAVCGYPSKLRGKLLSDIDIEILTCDNSPKPRILEHPKTKMAIKGENATLSCKAISSSSSTMEFVWRRNDSNILNPIMKQYIIEVNNSTLKVASDLLLNNVSDSDSARYQCVVSNNFGMTYSNKSQITIVTYPKFKKVPANITVKAGEVAELECAAGGDPMPQMAWQKDGGNDFIAARERRMQVMAADDKYFIINTKAVDMGVYSCIAQNIAGSIMSNATLTVLEAPHFVNAMENKETKAGESVIIRCMVSGSPKPSLRWLKDEEPLKRTERHFFTAEDQLLIIENVHPSDEGLYECEISNSLGTVKDSLKLRVLPHVTTTNSDEDMMGIIIITVVCCAVVTSIVWVFIIYHTKKRMNSALPQFSPDSLQLAPLSMDVEMTNPQLFNSDNISERSSCKDSGTGDSAKRSSLEIIPCDDIQQIGSNTIVPMFMNSSHLMDENRRLLKKDDNIKAFYSDDCEHSVTVQMHVPDDMLNDSNLGRTYPYS